jgi:hypothetical protein
LELLERATIKLSDIPSRKSYPYAPCMEYLPTFALKNHPNVGTGKYTIHGASGILLITPNFW